MDFGIENLDMKIGNNERLAHTKRIVFIKFLSYIYCDKECEVKHFGRISGKASRFNEKNPMIVN